MLINIDNGGTFTDVCAIDGAKTHRVKTPTTPFDLSECFFEGLRKLSAEIYGKEDTGLLLANTECIRYSTTQGTNALVQRKGPRIGLIVAENQPIDELYRTREEQAMFEALVGSRVARIAPGSASLEAQVLDAVNRLTLAGANRIVLSLPDIGHEPDIERLIRRRFPEHLLGTVPVIAAGQLSKDPGITRRTWTALFNAFLHPSMEKFLYYAQNRLKAFKFRSPLLIYRNDGDSGRVAKTTAIRTYSSGPRGGMDGARALARQYRFEDFLTMDVGGTTTDIGLVSNDVIRETGFGRVEGVDVAFPLCDIVSIGVGGGSIIRANTGSGKVDVGPQSVGAAPGPACFGLGGTQATITDVALLSGIIDPATYFGGKMSLDATRSQTAVQEHVAGPRNVSLDAALLSMEKAWVDKVATSLNEFTRVTPKTVLGAFGGAGPLLVCAVADAAGISRVIIPEMAAVFCAFGIGFSDVGHTYQAQVAAGADETTISDLIADLAARAESDMFSEGHDAAQCIKQLALLVERQGTRERVAVSTAADALRHLGQGTSALLTLRIHKEMPHAIFAEADRAASRSTLTQSGTRTLLAADGTRTAVPLYFVAQQPAGARGQGPAVLEDDYYTLRVTPGWEFEFTPSRDILLTRKA